MLFLFSFGTGFVILFALYIYDYMKLMKFSLKNTRKNLNFGPSGNYIPDYKDLDYYREIPCNKDIIKTFWVALQYNITSTSTIKEGVMGAILLKWFKDKKITICNTRKGFLNFKDNNYAIDFSNMENGENEIENKLLEILRLASGNNKILEAKELEKWCRKNYGSIEKWFYELAIFAQNQLEQEGLIKQVEYKKENIFMKEKIFVREVSPLLREEAIKLKGLNKFLLDFSVIDKREYYEVHIWEEYLIFAQLLGIADKVETQFSKIYPKFNNDPKLNINLDTSAIINMAHLGYMGYEEGKRKKYF